MKLKNAIKEAEKNSDVKEIFDKDGFLCSAYTMLEPNEEISEWSLNFYDPKNNMITQFTVSDSIKKDVTDQPLKEDVNQINPENIETEASEALKTAKKEVKKVGQTPTKIILSLQENEWSINFITASFSAVMVKINTETGEVNNVETKQIMD